MTLAVSVQFRSGERMRVGELRETGRDTVFRYDDAFRTKGIELSPFRLPCTASPTVYDFSGNMETFGLFEDSLPDGWGRRLVDRQYQEIFGRLPTVLERLACVGTNGMGALVYEPEQDMGVTTEPVDFAVLAENAMDFDAGLVEEALPAVRQAGGSSGGARPKALVGYNPVTGEVMRERLDLPSGFEHWIVKFNTRAEGASAGEREFRYYEAAVAAGAEMSESRLLRTSAGSFFATRRFDRGPGGSRFHLASAAGLLHADFRVPGEEYALLFRLTDALTRDYAAKQELFRRVALNVLAHNRDDHLKNFAFLMDAAGHWRLAPFYDFTYAKGPSGWQTLSVSGAGANPTEADLMRLAADVSLKPSDADEILERVRGAVKGLADPV